jgi:hypothetical protein
MVDRLQDYEFKLARSRCGANATAKDIAAVEEHRRPLMTGACNIGSAIYMSAENWEKVARESDEAAKRELMKGGRLEELERAEAAAIACRRNRQLECRSSSPQLCGVL